MGKRPNPFAGSGFFPVLPNAGDTEWRAIFHCDGVGLLCLLTLDRLPLKEAVYRHNERRLRYASRNVGRFGTVSYFELIGLRPPVGSLHQYGIRPQRSGSSETSPV